MSILGAILAIGSIWALGASALAVAQIRDGSPPAALAADFATGAAIVATWGTGTIMLGFPLSLVPFYGLLAALAVSAFWRGPPALKCMKAPGDRWTRGILSLTGMTLCAIGLAATVDRLWWDGWAIWAFKARVLFTDSTLPAFFLDPSGPYGFAHLDYPLLVPLVDWWVFRHVGAAMPALASFTGFVWFALIPTLLWGALRGRIGERLAALAALGGAACWPVAFYATGGTADVVMALALLGAVIGMDDALARGNGQALWRASLFLAVGAASKNEGLALAFVALGVGLFSKGGIPRIRRLPALLLPFFPAGLWFFYTRGMGLESDVLAGWPGISEVLWRSRTLARALLGLFGSPSWLPLSALGLLGLAALIRRPHQGLVAGWMVLGVYFAVLCGVYVTAPQDLDWLIATSMTRVFSVFGPVTVFLSLASVFPGPTSRNGVTGAG